LKDSNQNYRHLFKYLALILLFSGSASAATITVTNTNDSGAGSLRRSMADAAPDDTINFSESLSGGTIILASQLVVDKNLRIQGPGASQLSISGNHACRVFLISAGVTVTLTQISISDGFIPDGDSGAGINNAGTLTINYSAIRNNTTGEGEGIGIGAGGIYNTGTLIVNNSDISSNTSYVYTYGIGGGGIANRGVAYVSHSTLSNNLAYESSGGGAGGGISNFGAMTVDSSKVTGNEGQIGGGIDNRGTITISNSSLTNNFTPSYGGGIFSSGRLTFSTSSASGNTATYGGGIFIGEDSDITIDSSTIAANAGGGIYTDQYACPCTVFNSTISGNLGNGIQFLNSYHPLKMSNTTISGNMGYGFSSFYVFLSNTIVAGNTGGDVHTSIGQFIHDARHNLIGDGASSGGIINGVNGNIVGINPILGPLQNNGGPTMTHALLASSPAINAGTNTLEIGATDQRGAGFPRIVGGTVDIGAFELATQPSSTVSGRVTTLDGSGLRSAIVSLIDSNGVRRTSVTSSLGYYSFYSVTAGQLLTISVQSRRYRFSTNQLQVNAALTTLDFVAIE
jgi:hypothetical protein